MRIRYTKPGGREVDMADAAARRLIASGQAEEAGQADAGQEEAAPRPKPARKAAAKKSRGSR